MHRANRRGITWIEVLAVIIVLGLLVALLIPAMRHSENSGGGGRRAACQNNLKQLGLGTINYESSNKSFPGFRNPPLHQQNVSWVPPLLPYFEYRSLFTDMESGKSEGQYLNWLVCPTNYPATRDPSSTPLAYVANSGRFNNYPRRACDGVFLDLVPSDADPVNPEPVKVSSDYIGKHDGASYTLMYAERLYCYPATSSPPTPTDGDYRLYDNESVPTQEGRVAFSWVSTAGAKVSDHISSRHVGGANVVFCDGSVRFLRDGIDYEVYQQLMTPNGAEAGVSKAINPTEF